MPTLLRTPLRSPFNVYTPFICLFARPVSTRWEELPLPLSPYAYPATSSIRLPLRLPPYAPDASIAQRYSPRPYAPIYLASLRLPPRSPGYADPPHPQYAYLPRPPFCHVRYWNSLTSRPAKPPPVSEIA
eukprot:287599-Rhodomonas_salina.4